MKFFAEMIVRHYSTLLRPRGEHDTAAYTAPEANDDGSQNRSRATANRKPPQARQRRYAEQDPVGIVQHQNKNAAECRPIDNCGTNCIIIPALAIPLSLATRSRDLSRGERRIA